MKQQDRYWKETGKGVAIVDYQALSNAEKQALEDAITGFGCVPDTPPVIRVGWAIRTLAASIRYNDATPDYENWTKDEMEQQKNLLLKLSAHWSCQELGCDTTKQYISEEPIVKVME